jgi:allantoin racemase
MQFDASDPKVKKFLDLIEADFRLVKREDTEIKIVPLPKGIASMEWMAYPGFRFLNEREILKCALEGEKQGYDGILIANYFESGLWAARQLSSLPVIGFAEATMFFACTAGNKFATIVANEKFIVDMERTIDRYGLRRRALDYRPVRPLTITYDDIMECFRGDDALLINDFRNIARTCIGDGAEVIIAGGGLFSIMLTQGGVREVDGVPVLDPFIISLKNAEMAVDLHKSGIPVASRERLYYKPDVNEIEEAMEYF